MIAPKQKWKVLYADKQGEVILGQNAIAQNAIAQNAIAQNPNTNNARPNPKTSNINQWHFIH